MQKTPINRNSSKEFTVSRNSSSEFNKSPKSSRHTGSFSPAQPRYEVNPDMLVAARHSLELKTSPKVQRSLPPLPPLPSHAQAHSPAASRAPASHALPPLPATPASPALNPQTPATPPSPTLAPSLSKSAPDVAGQELTPLSPTGVNKLVPRRALPSLPPTPTTKRTNLPRAITSPDLSTPPPPPQQPPPPSSPVDPSPSPTYLPPSENPQTQPEVNEQDVQDKKDTKYYSNPEPAVTVKDGLCQRHLSAPSSVIIESELTANAESNAVTEVPVQVE